MSASLTVASLVFVLDSIFSVSAGQRNIPAEPEDNVILTCRAAENKDVIVVEWRRTDLESDQPVLLYRDNWLDPDFQSSSFRNRVSLLDVKNGDVSLVLKNVTTDDCGTYECRVVQGGNNRRKRYILKTEPISTFNLRVEAGNKEGGNKDGLKEDGGSKTGWIVGVSFCAGLVVLLVAVVFYQRSRYSSQRSQPPAAADAEEMLTGPDE
ncbi:butyrophilin-like protein 2 isoform X2 [Fundulus heteroclitus]|uniref:butyrophilin-like protein 2 isoform X2 n=1 Tax=Fundulus heteroclitus TaxID=8078 RepID=UPI00165C98C0|nr:butyrophilin-like protein 2 isoform X2 [Fundulus heteroclitus]